MSDAHRAFYYRQAEELEENVREVIELAGGDVRHALKMAIIANTFLQEDNERLRSQVSKGFARVGPEAA